MWPNCTLSTVLSLILVVSCPPVLAQEEKAAEPAKASITGKVFYHFGYPPSPDAPVYLFTLEQTKALRALEESVDKRVKDPHLTQNYASFLESEYTEQRVILIENLPREALTKTNSRGVFKFTNVVPGRR